MRLRVSERDQGLVTGVVEILVSTEINRVDNACRDGVSVVGAYLLTDSGGR